MGLGAGAVMGGLNSWSGNDCRIVPLNGPDEDAYLPLCRACGAMGLTVLMPWLKMDRNGRRSAFVSNGRFAKVLGFQGDTSENYHYSANQQLARGGEYWIFDSNWRTYNESWFGTNSSDDFMNGKSEIDFGGRFPNIVGSDFNDQWGIGDFDADWQDCVDHGYIVEAQTIEGLAEKAGLDPEKIAKAVEEWNAVCERGYDDEMYGYDPAWLFPVNEPPYYIARLTPSPYATRNRGRAGRAVWVRAGGPAPRPWARRPGRAGQGP